VRGVSCSLFSEGKYKLGYAKYVCSFRGGVHGVLLQCSHPGMLWHWPTARAPHLAQVARSSCCSSSRPKVS
jgi:hypothetical protein